MKKHAIFTIALVVLFVLAFSQNFSFAFETDFPAFITADTPGAYLIESSPEAAGIPCFNLRVQLSYDESEVLVYAENNCRRIVKLVRFTLTRGPLTVYHRPDSYHEEGIGILIHRAPYTGEESYARGDYLKVKRKTESNHITP